MSHELRVRIVLNGEVLAETTTREIFERAMWTLTFEDTEWAPLLRIPEIGLQLDVQPTYAEP